VNFVRSRSLVQAQMLVIQSPLKLVKIVKLNFLQKFTPVSPVMLYVAAYAKIASYFYYVLYK